MSEAFQVKSDPELWEKLGMDVARFSGMPAMLTQAYTNIFLSQKNRPGQWPTLTAWWRIFTPGASMKSWPSRRAESRLSAPSASMCRKS